MIFLSSMNSAFKWVQNSLVLVQLFFKIAPLTCKNIFIFQFSYNQNMACKQSIKSSLLPCIQSLLFKMPKLFIKKTPLTLSSRGVIVSLFVWFQLFLIFICQNSIHFYYFQPIFHVFITILHWFSAFYSSILFLVCDLSCPYLKFLFFSNESQTLKFSFFEQKYAFFLVGMSSISGIAQSNGQRTR